jgi:uncharacterized membrane protein
MGTGVIVTIVLAGITLVAGIIGFFLKKSFNKVDQLDQDKASKAEFCELEKKVAVHEKTIGEIKTNYLTKEDFFREQAKTDRMLSRIYDVLLEIKGGGKHG